MDDAIPTKPAHPPSGLAPAGASITEAYCQVFLSSPWAVVEYYIFDQDAVNEDYRKLIYITATKLADVFNMSEARKNTEWSKLVGPDTYLFVKIVFIGEKMPAIREASRRTMATHPRPHCNLRGYNTNGVSRKIACSNGVIYHNQTEASRSLKIAQGQISRHLNGELTHVKGLTFSYVET